MTHFLHINTRLKSSADLTQGSNFFHKAFWHFGKDLGCFFLFPLAVLPGAQSRDYPLGSDACNHDQFPARVGKVGTQLLGLSFFIVSTGGVFLSVIAAGTQLCDGEEKRENETPLRYKSIPYLSGFFFFKWIFSSFSFSTTCNVMKAMGTQDQLDVYLFDATNLKKCHFISNVSIHCFMENKSVLESPQSTYNWLLLA